LRRITRNIYDRKREQIVRRQHELGRLLQDSHDADSDFKIALSSLISRASRVPALFESSNNAEKRTLIRFAFSNLALRGTTLEYSLRKPFDLFVGVAERQEWPPA
jgi:hypothetical protein